jgi:hypothetical protein
MPEMKKLPELAELAKLAKVSKLAKFPRVPKVAKLPMLAKPSFVPLKIIAEIFCNYLFRLLVNGSFLVTLSAKPYRSFSSFLIIGVPILSS